MQSQLPSYNRKILIGYNFRFRVTNIFFQIWLYFYRNSVCSMIKRLDHNTSENELTLCETISHRYLVRLQSNSSDSSPLIKKNNTTLRTEILNSVPLLLYTITTWSFPICSFFKFAEGSCGLLGIKVAT